MKAYRTPVYMRQLDKVVKLNNKKIIEIGCGDGTLCNYIAQYYDIQEIVGIDPKIKENTQNDKVKLLNGNAESIPYPDNYFDFALTIATFEHFQNPRKVLSEVRRVLKPYGRNETLGTGRFFVCF